MVRLLPLFQGTFTLYHLPVRLAYRNPTRARRPVWDHHRCPRQAHRPPFRPHDPGINRPPSMVFSAGGGNRWPGSASCFQPPPTNPDSAGLVLADMGVISHAESSLTAMPPAGTMVRYRRISGATMILHRGRTSRTGCQSGNLPNHIQSAR